MRSRFPVVSGPFFALLVLVSGIGPTCAAAAEAQMAKPADHVHGENACTGCHPDGVNLGTLARAKPNPCEQCHTADTIAKWLGATISSTPSPAESELERFIPDEPVTSTSGMRYPLYTPDSRLGAAPNEMATIPAGPFIRGTDNRLPDEGPQHSVDLPPYQIDIYEVTNLQYKRFVEETGRRSPDHFRNRTFPPGKADHPVTFVTWDDAEAYCKWAGKRLPTDKEWEKAARGTDGRAFPWGNEFNINKANTPIRWQAAGMAGDTTPVGAFAEGASPFGLYDVTGNVWEWTESWYEAYPGNTTPSESYGTRYKTLKGGSWFDCSFYKCGISAPVYNRAFFAKRTKNDTFGFRCAKDPS